MSKVYVVQDDGRKNLAPALAYGDIEVLATRDLTVFGNPANAIEALQAKLKDFDPDKDYLIPAGDPLLIGIAFHTIAAKSGIVPCLKWDRQSTAYFQVTIKI